MGRFLTALVVGGLLAAGASGQETAAGEEERQRLAYELLEVSGAGELGVQVMEQMVQAFKAANDQVTDEFWAEFMADVDVGGLTEMVIPIYTKHLTAEEMEAAIDFYRTPAGAAIIRKMPLIMQESMAAGQQWGMELSRSATERIEAWQTDQTNH
jgi:hypothetical protein